MTAEQQQLLNDFLTPYFGPGYQPPPLAPGEQAIIEDVLAGVDRDFGGKRYILGLAIDFALLAQKLSLVDLEAKAFRPGLTAESLFARYARVTEVAGRLANTLTLKFGAATEGIRRIEEQVGGLFNALGRAGYPSAYVYNTGQWHKYPDLMLACFRLSEPGRYALCGRLAQHGLDRLAENAFFGREAARPALYLALLTKYDRSARKAENGRLVYQALAYGFIRADRGHLDILADKVRTGSARQRRFGDIDGYYGLDLEVSVEVKDLTITIGNVSRQLGTFVSQVAGNHINGIVFAADCDDAAREELRRADVTLLTQEDVARTVRGWDWQKQERAVQGVLHYLAHVEQNPEATARLLAFIRERDQAHPSLSYLPPDQPGPAASSEPPGAEPASSPADAGSR